MQERRRHQRIRFSTPPIVTLGSGGRQTRARIENLSLSGLMVRCDLPLTTGQLAGCEFSLGDSVLIDQSATVITRLGDLYGLRFQPGLVAPVALADAMADALTRGLASVLQVHEVDGVHSLRISGGLNGSLTEDFLHIIRHTKIDELDLSGVTQVDADGLALCRAALAEHGARIARQSSSFEVAWRAAGG